MADILRNVSANLGMNAEIDAIVLRKAFGPASHRFGVCMPHTDGGEACDPYNISQRDFWLVYFQNRNEPFTQPRSRALHHHPDWLVHRKRVLSDAGILYLAAAKAAHDKVN